MAEKTAAGGWRWPAIQRPNITDYIDGLFTISLSSGGDRACREDPAILGGVALFHGRPVPSSAPGRAKRWRKTSGTTSGCRAGGLPQGSAAHEAGGEVPPPYFYLHRHRRGLSRLEAEEHGQGEAIARNLFEMSRLTVPVIAVVTGEGNSGGALALAVADGC